MNMEEAYKCNVSGCGSDLFLIFDDHVKCSGCGKKYYPAGMEGLLSPFVFNQGGW